ncbi:PepSY-associated TM helix domain-containing protein [Mycolicibacterium sp.]|uniref:PepSY-associated TM helix domain-containing protein n=2 Tax=Mycolicibacterium sp. TaxID=2320850 RepID=UPI003D0DECFE
MTLADHTSDPPPARTARPVVARLHFYAGILIAPFLIVAAVSGALYALAPTLERLVYDDILFVPERGQPLPLAAQVSAAQTVFPHLAVSGLRPPNSPTESTRIYVADPTLDEELSRAVFVDPYTGRVLGDEPTWFGALPVSTWLDGLHRHLHLGEPGRLYSEIAASWLWVVALGGLYLWLGKAVRDRRRGRTGRVLTVDRSAKGRLRTLNWHGATGVWLLIGLLFLSATGITWSTYAGARIGDIRTALGWQRPQLNDHHSAAHLEGTDHTAIDPASIDYAAVLATAAHAGVHLPAEISLPAEAGHALTVTEIDKAYRWTTNAVAIDPATTAVVGEIDYWRDYSTMAKLADWGIRAHMGFLFGLLNQLLLLTVALGLLAVIVAGYRMWWQRRPTRGARWTLGRPPSRGALRRLSPPVIGALTLTAVAVGWFLPLFGLTLAAFVAVDLTIGAVKHRRSKSSATKGVSHV